MDSIQSLQMNNIETSAEPLAFWLIFCQHCKTTTGIMSGKPKLSENYFSEFIKL